MADEDLFGLDDNDKELVSSLSENPQAIDSSIVPEELTDSVDPTPPKQPVEGPELDTDGQLDQIAAQASPATAPAQPGEVPGPATATNEAVITKETALAQQRQAAEEQIAARKAEIAQQKAEDDRLINAEATQRSKAASDRFDKHMAAFEQQKLIDPRAHVSTKSKLSVIFGALGGSKGSNVGLDMLQQKWKDDLALQKSNIDLAHDGVIMARTGVQDAREGRREMQLAADARYVAQLNSAIKQGELQLKKLGVPAIDIDNDKRLLSLKADRVKALAAARKAQDEHDLAQARSYYYKHGGSNLGAALAQKRDARQERAATRADQREERMDASDVIKEVKASTKEFESEKGVKQSILHANRGLELVKKDPNNPSNWVHLVDALIRSNTGRAAILSQYELFMGHAAPQNPEEAISQFKAKFTSGKPSPEQQKNIVGSAEGILSELKAEAKEFHDNLRSNYDQDDRLRSNPRAWEAYNRHNKNVFGTLPGYGGSSGHGAATTKPAAVPKPTGAEIQQMKAAQKAGDHDFDAILKQYGY